jgi:DNA-dependent RNA polymerase auxiliary subunit epsilon
LNKITEPFFKMLSEYNLCLIEYIEELHDKELTFEKVEKLERCMRHFEWVMKRLIKICVT